MTDTVFQQAAQKILGVYRVPPRDTGSEIKHSEDMTNRQQLGYLAVFVIGIVVLPAGLVALWSHPIVGVILILSALALSIQSAVELHRIRRSESIGIPDGASGML
jgi:hypothetical protein